MFCITAGVERSLLACVHNIRPAAFSKHTQTDTAISSAEREGRSPHRNHHVWSTNANNPYHPLSPFPPSMQQPPQRYLLSQSHAQRLRLISRKVMRTRVTRKDKERRVFVRHVATAHQHPSESSRCVCVCFCV